MELVPEFYVNDLRVDDYPFSVIRGEGGLDLGNPESIMQVIESMVVDGPPMESTGTTGRTLVLPLLVEGADLLELAQNEATLILACAGARNTVTLDPGDGYAPPTVFDTFKIDAKHTRDDNYEAALVRRWDLVIPASSWARSPDLITQTLEPTVTPSTTVLDPCTSAAAWSNPASGDVVTVSQQTYLGESVVRGTQVFNGFSFEHRADIMWTGAAGTNPYIYIDICWDGNGAPQSRSVVLFTSPIAYRSPFATESVAHGTGVYTRYWFENNVSATSLTFRTTRIWNSTSAPSNPVPLRIAQLVSADAVGGGGIMTIETVGSVRAPGSVTVTRVDPMDYALIYSDPAMLTTGYSPAVEDSWASAPAGTYVIYIKSIGADGNTVTVTVTDAAGNESAATTRLVDPPTFRPIGEVRLGGARDGRLGALAFDATVNGSPSVLTMANVRLFRKDTDTALTYWDGDGSTASAIEIATPSVDLPRGGMWVDDWAAGIKVPTGVNFPEIVVPQTALYVEVDGSDPAATSLRYFPRYHTYNAYVPVD